MDGRAPKTGTSAGEDGAPAQAGRRPYEKPEIIDYGTILEMTRGTGSKTYDYHGGKRSA